MVDEPERSGLKSWILCALRIPASTATQGFQLRDWRPIVVGRDEVCPFLVVRHHRRLYVTVWRRRLPRASESPCAAPRAAGGGAGGGRSGRARVPAPESSLGLAGHVNAYELSGVSSRITRVGLYWRRRGAWLHNLRPRCCMPSGPS